MSLSLPQSKALSTIHPIPVPTAPKEIINTMAYKVLVFAPRKTGVSHEQFKARYEQHMKKITEIAGDAMPISHTRWYVPHDGATGKPRLLMGNEDEPFFDVVVEMVFEDEAASQRFYGALSTDEAKAWIEADEAGFWDRKPMKVAAIEDVKETRK